MCPSLLLILALAQHRLPLRRLPLHLPLTSSLGLGPLGVHLLLEQPLALLLGLGPVDVLHQRALVLERVALGEVVQVVVEVLVDLAALAVLD